MQAAIDIMPIDSPFRAKLIDKLSDIQVKEYRALANYAMEIKNASDAYLLERAQGLLKMAMADSELVPFLSTRVGQEVSKMYPC